MKNKIFYARVIQYDNGKMVVEPYQKTGLHRYEYMAEYEGMTLSCTKKDYRIVFRFPRKAGLIAAARHLISVTAHMSLVMFNLDLRHNEK